ncbi:MAG: DNA-binding protein [Methanothrix sp.]|nr:MAG: DNA-binding protein [Methanothrix sp.]
MKRNRHTIVTQILNICKNKSNKTRIVYQANLNFSTVNPYLDLLIKNGLIAVKQEKTTLYETTADGINLLDNFMEIDSQLTGL